MTIERSLLLAVALAFAAGCSDDNAGPVTVDARTVEAGLDARAVDLGVDRGGRSPDMARVDRSWPDGALTPDRAKTPDRALAPDLAPMDATSPSCAAAKQAVRSEMARINTCATTSECAYIWGVCPFGCHIPHNKSQSTTKLTSLMTTFTTMKQCPQCTYRCAPPGTLSCVANVCTMTYP